MSKTLLPFVSIVAIVNAVACLLLAARYSSVKSALSSERSDHNQACIVIRGLSNEVNDLSTKLYGTSLTLDRGDTAQKAGHCNE